MRSYTQLARWKFREFNELPHIFQMRLHRSYPLAEAYVSQFPNDRMAQLARYAPVVVPLSCRSISFQAERCSVVEQIRSIYFWLIRISTRSLLTHRPRCLPSLRNHTRADRTILHRHIRVFDGDSEGNGPG